MPYALVQDGPEQPGGGLLVGSYTEIGEALTALDMLRERAAVSSTGRVPQRLAVLDTGGGTVAVSSYRPAAEPAPPAVLDPS